MEKKRRKTVTKILPGFEAAYYPPDWAIPFWDVQNREKSER